MISFDEFKKYHYESWLSWARNTFVTEEEFKEAEKQFNKEIKELYKQYIKEVLGIELPKEKPKSKIENPLKQEWLDLFSNYSVCNNIAGEILFYQLISLFTKDKDFIWKNSIIRPVLHFYWMQSSGSGKDKGIDFFLSIIERLNQYLDEDEQIKYYELSGAESPEVYIKHFARKGDKVDFNAIVNGLMEDYDLLIAREASFFFREAETKRNSQPKVEYMLIGLEGKEIQKTLISWNGYSLTTRPKFILTAISRPIAHMEEHLAYSGFLQRCFTYFRLIDLKERTEMMNKLLAVSENYEGLNKRKHDIVKKILDVRNFILSSKLKINSKLDVYIQDNIKSLILSMAKDVKKWDLREIVLSFIARYRDIAMTISILDAYSNKQKEVKKENVTEAFELIKKVCESIQVFIDGTLDENKLTKYRKITAKKIIYKLVANQVVNINEVITKLSFYMEISKSYAKHLLQKLMEDGFIIVKNNNIEIMKH